MTEMTREEAKLLLIRPVVSSNIISETKAREIKAYNMAIEALSTPTVIRSRTLLPTKDFKEWAKRIKEVNPNAVVIPCDAEVVSAGRLFDAVDVIKKEIQDFEANYMHGEDDENYEHDIGFVAGLHRAKTLIKALPSEMNKEESERSE